MGKNDKPKPAKARDECPNHHAAKDGVCSVGWCAFSHWNK